MNVGGAQFHRQTKTEIIVSRIKKEVSLEGDPDMRVFSVCAEKKENMPRTTLGVPFHDQPSFISMLGVSCQIGRDERVFTLFVYELCRLNPSQLNQSKHEVPWPLLEKTVWFMVLLLVHLYLVQMRFRGEKETYWIIPPNVAITSQILLIKCSRKVALIHYNKRG